MSEESYIGRVCFMCDNGHIHVESFDSAEIGNAGYCSYCNSQLSEVGIINDSRGLAECNFELEVVNAPEILRYAFDRINNVVDLQFNPGTYRVKSQFNGHAESDMLYNFDNMYRPLV